jgi:hypothetical protein
MRSIIANLAPASGRQDHTTSPPATTLLVLQAYLRPPQSRLTCRDDRDTPLLSEAGWREEATDRAALEAKCFSCNDWTTQISLNRLAKSTFPRMSFLGPQGVFASRGRSEIERDLPVGGHARQRSWRRDMRDSASRTSPRCFAHPGLVGVRSAPNAAQERASQGFCVGAISGSSPSFSRRIAWRCGERPTISATGFPPPYGEPVVIPCNWRSGLSGARGIKSKLIR